MVVAPPGPEQRTLRFSHNGQLKRSDRELSFLSKSAGATVVALSDAARMLPALAAAAANAGATPQVLCLDATAVADSLSNLCWSSLSKIPRYI